jgi:hypothetical protein
MAVGNYRGGFQSWVVIVCDDWQHLHEARLQMASVKNL